MKYNIKHTPGSEMYSVVEDENGEFEPAEVVAEMTRLANLWQDRHAGLVELMAQKDSESGHGRTSLIKVTGADLTNAIDYRVTRLKLALNDATEKRDFELAAQVLKQMAESAESRNTVSGSLQAKMLFDVELGESDRLRDELV